MSKCLPSRFLPCPVALLAPVTLGSRLIACLLARYYRTGFLPEPGSQRPRLGLTGDPVRHYH